MHYGKKHDLPFGIMDVAGLLRLNIRRRAPGQAYVDCPICGDRRGKMNLNTEKDLWRCNYCGEGGGMLSLYAKVYGVSNSDAYREICDALAVNGFSPDYTVPEKTTPAEAEQSDAASVQEVHQTLSMLLSMLTLIPAHREHLRSVRGLSDDEITRFGFKSTPPPFLCRSLTNRLVKAGCRVQGVPGFYVDDNGCWTVKFHQRTSGIIIPIFGVDGLIHGAQIRLDHPLKDKDDPPEKTGVKYLTLSSTGKRMGTTSGSPIHFVGDPCSRVVYVTEGCLKADVAHALMHRTFVATLGVNNTAKLDELFAFLHRNGTEEIIEAEDMDKYSNEMVEKGASKIYALAVRHGMRCRRLTWNPNYWERIEQQEAYILFLRKTAEIDKPYYTLEVEPNGTIRQKRTYFDRQNDDLKDAEKFLKEWQKVVSERLTESDREKAEKSKVLRLQEFEQLRQDDIRIHTGDLAGQRLVDVLVSDLMETAA